MRSRILSIFVLCFLVSIPNLSYSQVYFAGWVDSADEIANKEFQDEPEHFTKVYHPPKPQPIHKVKKHRSTASHDYNYDLPESISPPGEKLVVVDPRLHAWGAYTSDGKLLRSGLATAGAAWCSDIGRPCRTKTGSFRIYSLGDEDCISRKYPVGEGGAPMPYCMYFNGSQGLHGSYSVVAGNVSHGCVRMRVSDAEWLRYNFVNIGTKVIVKSY